MFRYKIPDLAVNQWPASFHMKRDVPNKGELKLLTQYRIKIKLIKVGQEVIAKNTRRFFIAKKPFNPR